MNEKRLMQVPNNVKKLHSVLHQSGFECHLVGGCVRDALLGEVPHDYDLCTNASPEDILNTLKKNNINATTVGIDYGTIVAHIGDNEYEITTYRCESGYSDKRHPDKVEYSNNINEDLKRRDFTINAIAYNLDTEEIVDPYQGVLDLEQGILRMVGNPADRINEDPLRMLRGIRFAIRFGFQIENNTKEAILENKELINLISKERITQEFQKMFSYGKPVASIFMEYAPVIFEIVPELGKCYEFSQNNKYHKHDVYEHILNVVDNCKTTKFDIKMAALLHDIGKPDAYSVDENHQGHFYGHADISQSISKKVLATDFRITNEQRDNILLLVKEHDHDMPITTKGIRKLVSEFGTDFINDWLVLKKGDISDHLIPDPDKSLIKKYEKMTDVYNDFLQNESRFQLKDLAVNGRDLAELSLQGPEIGKTLRLLLNAVIEEEISNSYHELMAKAEEINEINKETQER